MSGLERQTAAPDEIHPGDDGEDHGPDRPPPPSSPSALLGSTVRAILPVESLPFYFRHPAFLASFALSLLYLTVLSFSGQMITYLIFVGYNSLYVGIARVGSSIFEISATWAAPFLMKKIGVVRAGIWSLAWQMACLAGALGWYFSDFEGMGTNSLFSATGLAVGVSLSRMGLWGYDLSAQNIIQDVGRRFPQDRLLSPASSFSWISFTNMSSCRKSRTNTEGRSLPSRPRSKTCSRCSPTSRPSSSLAPISFSTRSSSPSQLSTPREVCMPTSCGCAGDICFTHRPVFSRRLRRVRTVISSRLIFPSWRKCLLCNAYAAQYSSTRRSRDI